MKPIWIILIVVVIIGVIVALFMLNKSKQSKEKATENNVIVGKKMSGKCFKTAQDYKDKMTTWLLSEGGKKSDWGKSIQAKATEQNKSYKSLVDSELKYQINNTWVDAPDCEYIDKTVI